MVGSVREKDRPFSGAQWPRAGFRASSPPGLRGPCWNMLRSPTVRLQAHTHMSLTVDHHRALQILLHAGTRGAAEATLRAHGCRLQILVDLIRDDLAFDVTETVLAGDHLVDVVRLRITEVGLAGADLPAGLVQYDVAPANKLQHELIVD
jgi:hypothetical protein